MCAFRYYNCLQSKPLIVVVLTKQIYSSPCKYTTLNALLQRSLSHNPVPDCIDNNYCRDDINLDFLDVVLHIDCCCKTGTHKPKCSTSCNGPVGTKGAPGEKGSDSGLYSNWKQCAWARSDGKDNGLIQECLFNKKHHDSSLKVSYGGNLRIYNCNSCCKRWYFTFNGAECKKPLAIDGVFYMARGAGGHGDIHRHRYIEGYCNKIPIGIVRVGFWVGNCNGYGNADAHSGWNSISRIVIEEVPPAQP
ncbi:Hypothetical predicted protein [Paramuricea clavata]|uniref:CTHRC1 C-terminal domain-containing protein n=1 Tax=Paramuricea clavata TaxID=317549 RepID=A0A7D9J0D1_PARCT|nr:Hypothetical predicted protein [Paramuricea clavata]